MKKYRVYPWKPGVYWVEECWWSDRWERVKETRGWFFPVSTYINYKTEAEAIEAIKRLQKEDKEWLDRYNRDRNYRDNNPPKIIT